MQQSHTYSLAAQRGSHRWLYGSNLTCVPFFALLHTGALLTYLLVLVFNTKFGYKLSNGIGIVKLLTLVFIAITGFVVLGGNTKVTDPQINFRESFAGKATAYGACNAMYKIVFSYAGFENAFNVVNEVKNPVKQLKVNAFAALSIVAIFYLLANVAYFSAGKSVSMAN